MADHTICRHFRGGIAHFRAGAALLKLDISRYVQVRRDVSMKVDANTVRIVWRADSGSIPSMIESILKSIEGPPRLICPANEYWIDFREPEPAHIALKILGTLARFETTLVYNVRFEASSRVADFISKELEQLAAEIPGVHHLWDRSQSSLSILRLSGDNLQDMISVKDRAQALFWGRIINLGPDNGLVNQHEVWHPFFSDTFGDMWLRHIGDQAAALIMADRPQERLRLYCRNNFLHQNLPLMLEEKIAKLDATQHTYTIKLSLPTWKTVIASSIMARANAVLGPSNAMFDMSSNALLIRCPPRTAQLLEHELSSPRPSIERVETHFECYMCGDSTRSIMLSSCEHVVCDECFDKRVWHILADPLGDHFPMRCSRHGCGEQIPLSDLRKLVSSGKLQSLFDASVNRHIGTFPERYRSCRTTACTSVYLASETARISTCSECLAQTCTFKNCGKEPHVGWNCQSYWVLSTLLYFTVYLDSEPLLTRN